MYRLKVRHSLKHEHPQLSAFKPLLSKCIRLHSSSWVWMESEFDLCMCNTCKSPFNECYIAQHLKIPNTSHHIHLSSNETSSETLWSCLSGKAEIWDYHHFFPVLWTHCMKAFNSTTAERAFLCTSGWAFVRQRNGVVWKNKWYISTL